MNYLISSAYRNPYVAGIEDHYDIIFGKAVKTAPNWSQVFNNTHPLRLDIGCGSGNFLLALARKCPDVNFVGIELKYKRLVKASQKFKKADAENIRLLQKRAEELALWFAPGSVEMLYVNFPDPWPKKRHHKHRLLQVSYVERIHATLIPGGLFQLKTDHEEYFQFAKQNIYAHGSFRIRDYSENLHRSEYAMNNITTEFETIFTAQKNIPIYFLSAVKI